ncbi:hypothetical protein WDU94_006235 [Cyamophila willieti]
MVQYRKVDPVKKRRIKRDMSLNSSRIKGIAGLRLGQAVDTPPAADPLPLAHEPQDHTSNDHNYSLIPAVPLGPSRRARIQSSILNDGDTDTVWYTDDPIANSIDDSSRHDHLYTRREALEQVRNPHNTGLEQVRNPHNTGLEQVRNPHNTGLEQERNPRAVLDHVRNPQFTGHVTYDTAHHESQRTRGGPLEQRMLRRSAFEQAADLHLVHFLGRVEDPFGYHSLVENGSGLSEIFHMLRFMMRDVRHILTGLRDQFLLWPRSVRIARCLELASVVRRLLVATDTQVLYPLFLEFSRIVQERLRSRQHGARQDDFLLQLNNEALDKARLCMCHSARLTPDYVSRARDILQRHVPRANLTNVSADTHQPSNTSSSNQQTSTVPSNTTSDIDNQEASSARPRRQLHTSLNRVVEMVEDQTIKYALFRDMLNIRRLLDLTLIRINEERAIVTPMERQEEAYFLSRDTWSGLHRVLHSVLELYCGPMSRNTDRTSPRPTAHPENPNRNQMVFVPVGYPEDSCPLSSVSPLTFSDVSTSSSASRTPSSNSRVDNASTSTTRNVPVRYSEYSSNSAHANPSFNPGVDTNSSRTSVENTTASSRGLLEIRPYRDRYDCSNNCTCPTCVFVEDPVTNSIYHQQSSSGNSSQFNATSHGNASEYSNNSDHVASISGTNGTESSINSDYPSATSWRRGSEYNPNSYSPGTNWGHELNSVGTSTGVTANSDLTVPSGMIGRGNGWQKTYCRTGSTGPAADPYSRYVYAGNEHLVKSEHGISYGIHSHDGSSGQVNRQVHQNDTSVERESVEAAIRDDYSEIVDPEFREAVHEYVPAELDRNTANPLHSQDNHQTFYGSVETPHNTVESDVGAQNSNNINEYIDSDRGNTLEQNLETVHLGSERENELIDNIRTYESVCQSNEVLTRIEGTNIVTVNDNNEVYVSDQHVVPSTNDQISNVRADNIRDIFETNNVILEENNVILDNNDRGNSYIPRDHQYTTEVLDTTVHHTSETVHNNGSCVYNSNDTTTRDSLAESDRQYYINLDDNQVLLTNESCDNENPYDKQLTRRRRRSCSRPNGNDSHRIDNSSNISKWDHQNSRQNNDCNADSGQSNQSICSYNTCDAVQCLCNTGTSSQTGNNEDISNFYGNQVQQEPSNTLPQSHPIPHCVFHETHSSYTHACPISDVTECQQRYDLATYPYRGNTVNDSNRNSVSNSYFDRHRSGDTKNSRSSSLSERFETRYQFPEYYFSSNERNVNNSLFEHGVTSSQYSPESNSSFQSASNLQTQRQRSSNSQSSSSNPQSHSGNSGGSYDNFGFEDILSQTNLSFNAKVFVPKTVVSNELAAYQGDNNDITNAGPHYANSNSGTLDELEDIPEHPDTTYSYESDTGNTNVDQLDDFETHCDNIGPIESNTRLAIKAIVPKTVSKRANEVVANKHGKKDGDLNEHNYTKDKSKEHNQDELKEHFQDEAKGGYDETDFEEDDFDLHDLEEEDLKQHDSIDETLVNGQTAIVEGPLVHRNLTINHTVINDNVEMNDIGSSIGDGCVPMDESLTVTDHNYAATTKHTQLTRQDSEHSYACKKLKSSRMNSKNKSKPCVMSSNDAKESKLETDNTMVNAEHAYSKYSVKVAAFDHEYAKAGWSETGLVDRMNYLTLQESEDEDDEDL